MKTSSSFLLPDRHHITLLYPTLHHPDLSLFYTPPFLYPSLHFALHLFSPHLSFPIQFDVMSSYLFLSHLLHSNSILLLPCPPLRSPPLLTTDNPLLPHLFQSWFYLPYRTCTTPRVYVRTSLHHPRLHPYFWSSLTSFQHIFSSVNHDSSLS